MTGGSSSSPDIPNKMPVSRQFAPAADTPHKIHKTPKIHLTIFPNNFIISPQLIKNN